MARGGYEVEWADPARSDLDGIVGRIASDRPLAAERVLSRLRALADSLSRAPERGRIVPELRALGLSAYREVVLAPWRLVYRIAGRTVLVLILFDARRGVPELLVERLVREP